MTAGRLGRLLAAVLLAAPTLAIAPAARGADGPVGPPPATPIEHFVFLFQENHSFDNYFGTRKGVDGIPAGVCMPRAPGVTKGCVRPYWLGDSGITDLGHSEADHEAQARDGAMDGFVWASEKNGKDGRQAMGFYDDRDLPFYWNVADEYVLFDRFFSSSRSGSIRNHMYAVAGAPGATGKYERIPEEGWGDLPTIFDRLEEKGVSWKFYVENYDPTITWRTRADEKDVDRGAQVIWVPLLAYARYVDDPRLSSHIVDMDQFYIDAATGNLPAVSYVAPSGNSEHPPGSIRAGQRLVRGLIGQLMRSPHWDSSAFLWSYDDWGGWYDHVLPPQVDSFGYGFRVPALLVSPYARRGYVDSTELDFTSILKFIEENWHLQPLAERDAQASSFVGAFDFTAPPRAPVILSDERTATPAERTRSAPVYLAYSGATVFVATLLVLAGWQGRRQRQLPVAAEMWRPDRPSRWPT